MHVLIESDPPGPLSTLTDLPDAKLAVLEGLNGIGKTLTVRLLQICSGSMPYDTDSAAWKSLCLGLGPFRVRVSGLSGVGTLEWQADSREWQTGPSLGVDAVIFQHIKADGKPTTMEAIRPLFGVERVAGDESLTETLAQEADNASDTLRAWARRYAAPSQGPLATLESALQDIRDFIPSNAKDRYQVAHTEVSSLKGRIRDGRRELEVVGERHRMLQSASELALQLVEFRKRAPDLTSRLSDLDIQIDAAQNQRRALDAQIAAMAGKVAMAGPAKTELSNARRTLERNREKLQRAASSAAAFAGPLGLAPDDEDAAQEAKRAQEAVIEDLRRQRTEIDATPAMRRVLVDLGAQLETAERQGLSDQLALEDEEGLYELTVHQARRGVQVRYQKLEELPPLPEAAEISDRLEGAQRTLSRIRALLDAMADMERFRRLVATNEDRVHNALVAADPKAEEEMRALDQRRRESDEALLTLAAKRAGLQEQLGSTGGTSTEQSLSEQLAALLSATGSTAEALSYDLESTQAELDEVRQALSSAETLHKEAAREKVRIESDALSAIAALHSDKLAWVLEVCNADLGDEAASVAQRLDSLEKLATQLAHAAERLGSLREQTGAVVGTLRNLAEHMRGRDVPQTLYSEPLENWLGDKFSAWFNLDKVREQLLPEARGSVAVDVRSREVRWEETNGHRTRPLEAFSSGEQAFAYTRARIGVLDDEPVRPRNRLIVLDEFGAFISHDRMNQLLNYLRDRAAENADDQVLVILPLSRDYSELAASAIGREGERLSELARQIEDRKYAVRVLL